MLWKVQVYHTDYRAGLEEDVQDVFIKKMFARNGKILVVTEENRAFEIDPRTRKATSLLEY